MSSATNWDVGAVGADIRSNRMPSPIQDSEVEGPSNHMSPRQIELDYLWSWYRCTQYEGRAHDWNGVANVGHIEHEVIARSGNIPPGFYDAGDSTVPLKFREPSTPYHLAKVFVNRFTSLLFSAKRHPKIEADDPDTEEWLNGFAEATRLWANMLRARTYGGAMGSVGLGFKFVRGKPFVEIYDPRWCKPEFSDRDLLTVKKLEKLYQFVEQEQNEDGEWEEVRYWYRRVITRQTDIEWAKVLVVDNELPNWLHERSNAAQHNYGFCPIVWVQNQQVDDEDDGDSDCHGCYKIFGRIDALLSQADRGTVANCDPSLVISSNAEFDEVRKGSGNALHVEQGGAVTYMEMDGSGVKAAVDLAEKLEEKACTIARCMLDRNEGGPSRTAREVDHNYSSMIEQADVYREQYGEKGVKTLLEMVLQAARKLSIPRIDASEGRTAMVKSVITLPKKRVVDEDTGKTVAWKPRVLGEGNQIELSWPDYFEPSASEVSEAVDAAGKAKEYNLIDQEHATKFITSFFDVENKTEMIRNIEAQRDAGILPDPAEAVGQRSVEEGDPAPPGGW